MYWASLNSYTPSQRRAFEDYERICPVPMRIVEGRGRMTTVPDWTVSQSRGTHDHAPIAECRERGVTIIHNGSLNPIGRRFRILPVEATRDLWLTPANACDFYDVLTITSYDSAAQWPEGVPDTMVFGEVGERVICTHFPLVHYSSWLDLDLMLTPWISKAADEDFAEGMRERREAESRVAFAAAVSGRADHELEEASRMLLNAEAEVGRSAQHLATQRRAVERFRNDYDRRRTMVEDATARVDPEVEWERIVAHPRIENIMFRGGLLIVHTDEMTMTNPLSGETAMLGKFRVDINTEQVTINVHNLTNPRGGFDHPHCNQGRPCFGELDETVYDMIGRRDFAALIELVIVYLSSVNPVDDWGRRGAMWFDPERDADNATVEAAVAEPELGNTAEINGLRNIMQNIDNPTTA